MNASGRCARRRSKTTHSSLLPSSMRRTCPRSRGILVQLEWSQQSLKLLSPTFWQWLPVSTGGSSQAKPEKYFYFLSISWRSHIIPPTPDTQAELDLDTRYIFFLVLVNTFTHISGSLETAMDGLSSLEITNLRTNQMAGWFYLAGKNRVSFPALTSPQPLGY